MMKKQKPNFLWHCPIPKNEFFDIIKDEGWIKGSWVYPSFHLINYIIWGTKAYFHVQFKDQIWYIAEHLFLQHEIDARMHREKETFIFAIISVLCGSPGPPQKPKTGLDSKCEEIPNCTTQSLPNATNWVIWSTKEKLCQPCTRVEQYTKQYSNTTVTNWVPVT